MLLRSRPVPEELLAMRSLDNRMELTQNEKFRYSILEKGYEGEVKFDKLAEGLHEEIYIINDLLLKVNNSYIQIDTLLILQGLIHLLDIKNYQGDYYLEDEKLFSVSTGHEYKNPLDQLKRCSTLFRQLLQNLKLNFLFESSVIFINPEFTLYQTPRDQPIVFPGQVHRFLNDINKTPSKLNEGHKKLAHTLISLHQPKNPFIELPQYDYDKLKKGNYCKTCGSFQVSTNSIYFVCRKCGEKEGIEQAILRNVDEFKLLFPDRKITTQSIYEWCEMDLHRRTFSRALKKNYTTLGKTKDTYYI
jgi:predicted RNA-binding Zn-ribbon protein involved in translation (DUF1610 family)